MSGQPQPQPLPPLENLIKANQIQQLAAIPAEEKEKYYQGVKSLWDKINTHPQEHPEYQNAYKRLAEFSVRIKGMINKHKQQMQNQNQSHPAPPPSGKKPSHGDSRSHVKNGFIADRVVGNNQFSDRIMEIVRGMKMLPPPQYWARPQEEGQAWIREAKLKYAQAMQRVEQAKMLATELNRNIRERQHKPFSPEEQVSINNRRAQYGQAIAGAEEYLNGVRNTQEQWKLQQQQQQLAANGAASRSQAPSEFAKFSDGINISQAQESAGAHLNMAHAPLDQQPSAVAGTQSIEATRARLNQELREGIKAGATTQPGQISSQATTLPINTSQAPSTPAGVNGTLGSHLSINMNSAHSQQQEHSSHGPVNLPSTSQSGQAQVQGQGQGPHPLSHKAATQAARSYSQPSLSQATPQSQTHPQVDNRTQQNKWPIPKQLQVSELRPVPMGPARPSLSGGPSTGAPGPMGQPGIQKVPGYVLEGEGERVLSKKKLAELVTQVTGAVGTDTVPLLDPDVEEVS